MSWLVFVRTLCVDWLTHRAFGRAELHDMCVGAPLGALRPVMDLDRLVAAEDGDGSRAHGRGPTETDADTD